MASCTSETKKFIFSGFTFQHPEVLKLHKYIEELGGVVVDRKDKFTFLCTHVIAKTFQCTEKILAGLAAGKWLLKTKYLEDSYKKGHWLDERNYELQESDQVAKYFRIMRIAEERGLYDGWTFYVKLCDKSMTRSCRRILTAGDGEIVTELDISKACAVLSEKSLIGVVREKVGPSIPIIDSVYIKDTLILKRLPQYLRKYLLDGRGVRYLPPRANKNRKPVEFIEEKPRNLKRFPEGSSFPNKRLCISSRSRCPSTPVKQTRIDQFIRVGATPEVVVIPESPLRPSTSKHVRRRGLTVPFSPEKNSLITQFLVKKEPISRNRVNGDNESCTPDTDRDITVLKHFRSKTPVHKIMIKSDDDSDCFLTRVERNSLKPDKISKSKTRALISSINTEDSTKNLDLHIPKLETRSISSKHNLSLNKLDDKKGKRNVRDPDHVENEDRLFSSSFFQREKFSSTDKNSLTLRRASASLKSTVDNENCSKTNSIFMLELHSTPREPVSSSDAASKRKSVKGHLSKDRVPLKENLVSVNGSISQNVVEDSTETSPLVSKACSLNTEDRGAIEYEEEELPELLPSRTVESSCPAASVFSNKSEGERDRFAVSSMNNENSYIPAAGSPSVDFRTKNVKPENKLPAVFPNESIKKDPYESMKKVSEEAIKAKHSKSIPVHFSVDDLKGTVMKFVKFTKYRKNTGFSSTACMSNRRKTDLDSSQTEEEDLQHLLNPASTFRSSLTVRELDQRETAQFESSCDDAALYSKLEMTDKETLIYGMDMLKVFVTPFTYPPPHILGHLLQNMAFEVEDNLVNTRAIEFLYLILEYFPPTTSQMRTYYAKALEAAAILDKSFTTQAYLLWKFISRPIEALQEDYDTLNEATSSSSVENDDSRKKSCLMLLKYIVALVNADLLEPNFRESVKEHLTWRIFFNNIQDWRQITPPVKQLLRLWVSSICLPVEVRFCLGSLVSAVMEVLWRCERPMLLPVNSLPESLNNFANHFLHLQGIESKVILQLQRELPSAWSRSVFGSIVFLNEAQNISSDISLREIVEYGSLIHEENTKSKSKLKTERIVDTTTSLSSSSRLQKKINKRNFKGETKLMRACMKGSAKDVQELLSVPGIDVNLCDNNGWTPLHEAALRGHYECVKLLLNYNGQNSLNMKNSIHLYLKTADYYTCSIFAKSHEGYTALHDAVSNNHLKTVKLLLDYGGDALLNIENNNKETAFNLFASQEMQELLKSYKGMPPLKGSHKLQHVKRQCTYQAGISNRHILLKTYDDRLQFLVVFTNNYLEATGIRFCRFNMTIEKLERHNQQKSTTKELQATHDKTSSVFQSQSSLASVNSSRTGENKIANKRLVEYNKLSKRLENLKLTEAEEQTFNELFAITYNNIRLCSSLTVDIDGPRNEPDFLKAMRNLFV
ncbi:hypothetical protein SK128_001182 [Halocaridina rubra]|uniref:BRCT domain-containing protein n=1 Tax=Halocaridina rubra TaxID=373956 RepID=A0AAN8ZTK7_HALRR